MSLNRIFAIASNVLRETIRDQILYLSLVYSVVLVAAVVLLPQLAASAENKIMLDVGVAAIEVIGLIVAVFIGTNLVNKEIEKRTIFVLVAKPVSRSEFILGKHLGISAVLAVLVSLMSAIFTIVMAIAKVKIPVTAILISNFFTFWQLMLLGSIAILFGTFTSSLIAALLTFAIYLAGNSSKDLLALGEISTSESIKNITRSIYLLLPDLSRANLKNEAVYGILPSVADLFNNGVYILAYALLMLSIAILLFSNRQF